MLNRAKVLRTALVNSKNGKAIFSNFSYLLMLKIASYVFPLVTIPYLARVIGVEGFGKIAFAAAVIMWFQTITDWGFNYTATRDIAKIREEADKVSEIFSNVMWARMILMILSFLILFITVLIVPYFQENKTILLVTFLIVPSQLFFPEWFFHAMERMKYITIAGLLSKMFVTVLVFVFINDKSDFVLQPLFISLGYIVSGLISTYIIVCRWKVRLRAPDPNAIFKVIKESSDVFINNIMPNLYNSFSTVLVGVFSGDISNGLLDAGRRFIGIGQEFINLVAVVFFPYLSRTGTGAHQLYARLNLSIAFLLSTVLFFSAPVLIETFYTDDFYSSIMVLRIMCAFLFFHALINVYGVNFLIVNGFERKFRNITVFFSIAGFAFLFPVVYMYDYIGAAILVTAVRGLIGLAVYREYVQNQGAINDF